MSSAKYRRSSVVGVREFIALIKVVTICSSADEAELDVLGGAMLDRKLEGLKKSSTLLKGLSLFRWATKSWLGETRL